MKIAWIFMCVTCVASCLNAQNTITFFFTPYSIAPEPLNFKKIEKKLQKPGGFATYLMQSHERVPLVAGIFVSYRGQLTVSDFDGKVTFNRTQVKPAFTFLVTSRIVPIMMLSNTVHHLEIDPDVPSDFFTVEYGKNEDDPFYIWDVKKAPLPANNIIPLNAIIIFTQPNALYIPEGVTITKKPNVNLLPPLFVKKNINKAARALGLLPIRHFFGSSSLIRHRTSESSFAEQMTP